MGISSIPSGTKRIIGDITNNAHGRIDWSAKYVSNREVVDFELLDKLLPYTNKYLNYLNLKIF